MRKKERAGEEAEARKEKEKIGRESETDRHTHTQRDYLRTFRPRGLDPSQKKERVRVRGERRGEEARGDCVCVC